MKTMTILSFLLTIFLSGTTRGCDYTIDTEEPSKNYITKEIKVEDYSKIVNEMVGNVYYTYSEIPGVKIHGPENIVKAIEVKNENGTLKLYIDKKLKKQKKYDVKIYLSSSNLQSIINNGVGGFYLEEEIKADDLKITHNGVGNLEGKSLNINALHLVSNGVGNVQLNGSCEKADFILKGVGDINAFDFKVNHLKASSKGVGNIKCFASESIEARCKGVGDIKYKGNPKETNHVKRGVGKISSVN